jgi:hypothetical protein
MRAKLPRGFQDIQFLNGILACSAFLVTLLWTLAVLQLIPVLMLGVLLGSSEMTPLKVAVALILVYPKAFLGICVGLHLLLFLVLKAYLRGASFKSGWPLPLLHACLSLVPLSLVLYLLVASR